MSIKKTAEELAQLQTIFNKLLAVDVSKHVEIKDTGKTKLSYLSWAWAWAEVKSRCPDATYEIIKFNGLPYVYDDDTGYMCYTTVTIDDITHEMWLPVMDGNNRAMKNHPYDVYFKNGSKVTIQPATMFDINKTIMRCLTKNLGMFGLGLSLYAGVDLIDFDGDEIKDNKKTSKSTAKPTQSKSEAQAVSSEPVETKPETPATAKTHSKTETQAIADEFFAMCDDFHKDKKEMCIKYKLNSKSTYDDFSNAMASLRYDMIKEA